MSVIVGFYFGHRASQARPGLRMERLVLAGIAVAAWYAAPALIFAVRPEVEEVVRLLEQWRPWGDSVIAGIVAFYFGGT